MRMRLLFVAVMLGVATPSHAEEIRVMVSGGFTAAYRVLAAEWEKATGHRVTTVYGASMGATPTSIPNRLAQGEPADIVILARTALDGLVRDGRVIDRSVTDLVRSRIGMAVKAGAKKPDISTAARFRQVLLDAPSIAYSESASGVYISTELFPKLGVADRVAGKSKMIAGGPVGEAVAKGEAAIGFQQISELLPVSGITFVGPIPDAVQLVTIFSAGITTTAPSPAVARELVAFLASKDAWKIIRASGLEPAAAVAIKSPAPQSGSPYAYLTNEPRAPRRIGVGPYWDRSTEWAHSGFRNSSSFSRSSCWSSAASASPKWAAG